MYAGVLGDMTCRWSSYKLFIARDNWNTYVCVWRKLLSPIYTLKAHIIRNVPWLLLSEGTLSEGLLKCGFGCEGGGQGK